MSKNANLYIHSKKDTWRDQDVEATTNHPGTPESIDIMAFKTATEMNDWEQCAYNCYTQKRCEEENINTLADLFGEEFHNRWFQRRNELLKQEFGDEYEQMPESIKEYLEQNIGTFNTLLYMPVLYQGWELDDRAWIVETKTSQKWIVFTDHGRPKISQNVQFLQEKQKEYQNVLEKTEKAIQLMQD